MTKPIRRLNFESPKETIKRLDPLQRSAFNRAVKCRNADMKKLMELEKAKEETNEAIANALAEGVPAALLAKQLSFSRARIYQIVESMKSD